ncbi:STAS domain-containing protein [Streptomyces sp. V3I8]|uniref:STAS domain-containing protein n=1 Tax=Streptomyces sp. V3I8 TaxID=3042279 RepID=UPI0027D8E97A|nr:STAS domain-containing protein [Streptomyces sp. V3I8]
MLGRQYAQQGAWVVSVHGELDWDSLSAARTRLEYAAQAVPVLVLDVKAVTFADSAFLNLLLFLRQLTDLRLAGTSSRMLRVLEMTGADMVLRLFPTVQDALDNRPTRSAVVPPQR